MTDFSGLAITGRIATPGDPDWDRARMAWNLTADQRPVAGLDRLHGEMHPWRADGGYFNFADRPCDTDAILPADVCTRLAEVKRK